MKFLFAFLLSTAAVYAAAQSLSQNIRGTIVDKESQAPLIGVNIIIENSDPVKGTTTDLDGNFIFAELPLGRYSLKTQYLGYEEAVVNNINIVAGKESVIKIQMEETVTSLNEVAVSGKRNKAEALNTMSTVSARSFSVEETKRYAGSFNDPSRMASSYAGVSQSPAGNNDIIIRGNSPAGLQWRLEGIEIPNPNHFAEEGASGGPIGILNSNMLDNSDFFTSAFPAEYGNAYSGVFDIRLRKGNNKKREYSFMAGMLGLDCSAEGPFKKGAGSSYLFNYRYSSLALMNNIGIKVAGDAVPKYQDVAFKINMPTKSMGTFSIFGIGGISDIFEEDTSYQNVFGTDMGVFGISNKYRLGEKTYVYTTAAVTGSQNRWTYREPDSLTNELIKKASENFRYLTKKVNVSVNRKLNSRISSKTGFTYTNIGFNIASDEMDTAGVMEQIVERKGSADLLQAHTTLKLKASQNFTVNTGLHYLHLMLNNTYSIEPRLGVKWNVAGNQSINAGVGLHSKMLTVTNYFAQVQENGATVLPNKNLGFYKAAHFVAGYEKMLRSDLLAKIEIYYQHLYNIPVEADKPSSFSALNHTDGYTNMKLENDGTGRNYGIDLTVEKFFTHSYYFTFTSSLYKSKYTGSDNIERNTRFAGDYVVNVLGGKEFKLGKTENPRVLTISLKGTTAGGLRNTPIDLEMSELYGYTKRNSELAFSEQFEDFVRFDLKLKLTKNKKKTTRSWELDIQNVTNSSNVAGDYYKAEINAVETYSQMGILPVLSYRIDF